MFIPFPSQIGFKFRVRKSKGSNLKDDNHNDNDGANDKNENESNHEESKKDGQCINNNSDDSTVSGDDHNNQGEEEIEGEVMEVDPTSNHMTTLPRIEFDDIAATTASVMTSDDNNIASVDAL